VDGADTRGVHVVHFIWDADTGDLCFLCQEMPGHGEQRGAALDEQAAAQFGRYWLRRLGVASQTAHWRLISSPTRAATTWSLAWQSPQGRMSLKVDAFTGDLVVLSTWRLY
jgi:hypothetical protein